MDWLVVMVIVDRILSAMASDRVRSERVKYCMAREDFLTTESTSS